MPKFLDLTGKRFGKLIALNVRKHDGCYFYECKCDCGNTKTIRAGALTRKEKPTESCGCKSKPEKGERNPNYRHGHAPHGKRSKTLSAWSCMMSRCYREKDKSFHYYGGRGILVCERWHRFDNFLSDMGPTPIGFSIDRIDNNGNYEPDNCRWTTQLQQVRNSRRNIVVNYNGKEMCFSELCEITGVNYATALSRYEKGYPIEIVINKNNMHSIARNKKTGLNNYIDIAKERLASRNK